MLVGSSFISMVPPAPSAGTGPPMPRSEKPPIFANVAASGEVATEFFTMISFTGFTVTPVPAAVVSAATWAAEAALTSTMVFPLPNKTLVRAKVPAAPSFNNPNALPNSQPGLTADSRGPDWQHPMSNRSRTPCQCPWTYRLSSAAASYRQSLAQPRSCRRLPTPESWLHQRRPELKRCQHRRSSPPG